jgi:hypothetical protein
MKKAKIPPAVPCEYETKASGGLPFVLTLFLVILIFYLCD